MQLDEEERKLIEQHRLQKSINSEHLAARHVIASIASQWVDYSNQTGCGLTYSEFCDGFDIDSRLDDKYAPHRRLIFECVSRIYPTLNEFSGEIGKMIANVKG